jgi:hypothetical protein
MKRNKKPASITWRTWALCQPVGATVTLGHRDSVALKAALVRLRRHGTSVLCISRRSGLADGGYTFVWYGGCASEVLE